MSTNITLGILAHVDAGKTTLCEAVLYAAGTIRKQGAVNNGSTVTDYHSLERERGITIFTGEAHFTYEEQNFTILDTPGHVDFSAEAERTLKILDYAVLVISATEPMQAHTKTLWKLLGLYHVPCFVFVTKTDASFYTQEEIMQMLKKSLKAPFVNFSIPETDAFYESLALCDDAMLEAFLETGTISYQSIPPLIQKRSCFPCFFGSGTKNEGIIPFLHALSSLCIAPTYQDDFGAKVYRLTHDESGGKIAHLKITSGTLKVRDSINLHGNIEKIAQIYIENGAKHKSVESVTAGDICAVKGLTTVRIGDGLGIEKQEARSVLEPVMQYGVLPPDNLSPDQLMPKLRLLEEEDPLLCLTWQPHLQQIHALLMGEIQAQVLCATVQERFGISITLTQGKVLYKETVKKAVEGVGHYEPLRHYAEVHLLLEPLAPGSGMQFEANINQDELDRNWQRLILEHFQERQHLGVLTGSPLTDIKIRLVSGRAHLKHTEGGDFRQATYRAIRQGLMKAESLLLEPWLSFTLEVPQTQLGRAMNDIRMMSGTFSPPEMDGETAILSGTAPVTQLNGYSSIIASYTGGKGKLLCESAGYAPCHNEKQVIEEIGYNPLADPENSPDSVFCSHGAGFLVPWYEVENHMHIK